MKPRQKILTTIFTLLLVICSVVPAYASELSRQETPDYKVAFFAFDCYNMQDENGKKSGYGYEMMQGLAKYMQCTFSYVGYDTPASECEDQLRNGEIDLYTAAKKTPEREAEFAFSTHPSITSTTCMNVKVGNNTISGDDYSTFNGIRIGLLQRHTYNDKFLAFIAENNIDCEIVYYDTPTELTNALVNDEVDALVNSYIRIPEDEQVIMDLGETPYYIMARREDQALIDELDQAVDAMNIATPNWRTELYTKYYGSQEVNTEFTTEEQAYLDKIQSEHKVIRAVVHPDASPYAWYDGDTATGMLVDIFKKTADALGLDYEIIPVETQEDYIQLLNSGDIDVWIDAFGYYDDTLDCKYKITSSYLTSTASILRGRSDSEKIEHLVIPKSLNNIAIKDIISSTWPDAEVTVLDSTEQCKQSVLSGHATGALLMSYTAQKIAHEDLQNRLRVDIVPGASAQFQMGINANIDRAFYGLWEKTLANVSSNTSANIVQSYLDETTTQNPAAYLFDHPAYLIILSIGAALLVCMILLYVQSVKSKNRQLKIAGELALALEEAQKANDSKQNFFSKMSHDIRTPLNVVLGMTQVAQKYKHDPKRLEDALSNITSEGNYLLVLLNSILDVNQLEHSYIELAKDPFSPAATLRESLQILLPLAQKKEQNLTVDCNCDDCVVLGDANRLKQIIVNIGSNAIKYTPAGGEIHLKMEVLPDHYYRFTCTDNGIGMTPEFVQHICEDYARAEDSRVSKIHGTGLGMSIVKGFTDLMGGNLQIMSEPANGSTFIVEIPFPDASESQREKVLHPVQEEDPKDAVYHGRTVLLVEDNALNAEIAMELLQSIGLNVDWAENGKIGVELYQKSEINEYFAIFMDMQMPVMDGLEATQIIRSSDRADHTIPIFAMTANTFSVDRQKCRDSGMNGYIPKPVSLTTIKKTLDGNINQL